MEVKLNHEKCRKSFVGNWGLFEQQRNTRNYICTKRSPPRYESNMIAILKYT